MKTFPTLYKQTNTGKVQQWLVSVRGNSVATEFGQVDGKKQTVVDIVRAGKNIGRSNETTPAEQALLQAQQEFDGKLKEGYVEDAEVAARVKNTRAAVEPMLAFPIEKKEKYVLFPAIAQPKLDGLRCLAVITDGKARLFSRTQKEYTTVPHIVAELEFLYKGMTLVIDGELYSHEFKDDFNEISHLAKRDDVHEDSTKLEYHCYDVVGSAGYVQRTKPLGHLALAQYCFEVKTTSVRSREDLEAFQSECVAAGYEGCMYRNIAGGYEHKRSPNLLKVKSFIDDEFKIIGVEEGTGKLMGAVGAFILETKDGKPFGAKPMGTLARSQAYWKDQKSLIGKHGTVKFQNYTPDGIPRFPSFKCVRED